MTQCRCMTSFGGRETSTGTGASPAKNNEPEKADYSERSSLRRASSGKLSARSASRISPDLLLADKATAIAAGGKVSKDRMLDVGPTTRRVTPTEARALISRGPWTKIPARLRGDRSYSQVRTWTSLRSSLLQFYGWH